jgi:hypothetical protein
VGSVDFKTGFVRLKAEDTKTNEAGFPMTPELTALLRRKYKVRRLVRIMCFWWVESLPDLLRPPSTTPANAQGSQGFGSMTSGIPLYPTCDEQGLII